MLDDYEQKIIDNVAEHGWHCVAVGAGDDDPSFAYSVGLWETLKTPELITFGLPLKLMHSMLWSAFRQIKSGQTSVADGVRWSNLIDGHDCISRPVHRSQIQREFFNSAMWYRRHRAGERCKINAYQLFWPGKSNGLFPWERGCADIVSESQPQLYLPRKTGLA
jgi:Domain of unknown function (DUF4262)